MYDLKLFKVTRQSIPEWGRTREEWTRYFLASDFETVKAIVHERYGKPQYYSMDREETSYWMEEVQVEVVTKQVRLERDYWE